MQRGEWESIDVSPTSGKVSVLTSLPVPRAGEVDLSKLPHPALATAAKVGARGTHQGPCRVPRAPCRPRRLREPVQWTC